MGFTTAGGVSANKIAKWDVASSTWSALGTGLDTSVGALAVDSSGNLYAGGGFTTAGGVPANRIAKWDVASSTWLALGTNFNNGVNALAIDSTDNLYVGGNFTSIGTPLARPFLAKFLTLFSSWF